MSLPAEDPEVPERLAQELRRAFAPEVEVPEHVDREVLAGDYAVDRIRSKWWIPVAAVAAALLLVLATSERMNRGVETMAPTGQPVGVKHFELHLDTGESRLASWRVRVAFEGQQSMNLTQSEQMTSGFKSSEVFETTHALRPGQVLGGEILFGPLPSGRIHLLDMEVATAVTDPAHEVELIEALDPDGNPIDATVELIDAKN